MIGLNFFFICDLMSNKYHLTYWGARFILKLIYTMNLSSKKRKYTLDHIYNILDSSKLGKNKENCMGKNINFELNWENFMKQTLIQNEIGASKIIDKFYKNDFPYWISGFTDGEGSFYITFSKNPSCKISFTCTYSISQADDEKKNK